VSADTRVCSISELSPNTAKRVVVDGTPIAIVMDSEGVVHALGDTCTHGDISLAEGFVEDDSLECWAHGSKFGLADGKPRTLPVFTVAVAGDDVFIDPTPLDLSDAVAS
jgi:3-phenylpropionate/trans-cinnamate dioxygenase ferredoxin subunit